MTFEKLAVDIVLVEIDILWEQLGGAAYRPNFWFDAEYYRDIYQDIASADMNPAEHFNKYGVKEGRKPNRYHHLDLPNIENIFKILATIVTEPRLRALLEANIPEAAELAYELISLGGPVDKSISNFSARNYLSTYIDIANEKADPLKHYIQFGHKEKRLLLDEIRARVQKGKQAYDPGRRNCLICTHEFSLTGAPAVALDIAREASRSHNVIVMGAEGGQLLDQFCETACYVIVSPSPFEDWDYFDVPGLETLDFAIINSVECFQFIKPIVAAGIPFGAYIHEFNDYILPSYKSTLVALFSDAVIFSSATLQASWQGVLMDVGFDVPRHSRILAQANLTFVPTHSERCIEARTRLSSILGVDCGSRRIVYGAGQAQIRKGTDLFVLAAQQMRNIDPDTLFVWVGGGANHEDIAFGVWLDKHMREAGANTTDGNLFFIPAGPHYLDVCAAADVLFLPSRLDPLPNVVFDAARQGCTTVLFKNATGFDDICYDDLTYLVRVGYGDLSAACRALLKVPKKLSWRRYLPLRSAGKQVVAEDIAIFDTIHTLLKDTKRETNVPDSPMNGVSILFRGDDEKQTIVQRHRERARLSRLDRKAIWLDADTARRTIVDEGGWVHARTRIEPYGDVPADDPALCALPPLHIHIHAHYLDDLENDLSRFVVYRLASTVIATTHTQENARKIEEYGAKIGIEIGVRVIHNQGRDILPFLNIVAEHDTDDDALWCHVHQKKSVDTTIGGDLWREFLMRLVLGDDTQVSSAVTQLARPGTGLVTAFDPYIVGWNGSRRLIPDIERRLGKRLPDVPLLFPVGNMFWTRASVAREMLVLFGEDFSWPGEPLPNDGTVYHLIERLWPAVAAKAELGSVFLDRPGTRRA